LLVRRELGILVVMRIIILFSFLCSSLPCFAALTATEKDKILFMIFENQNKKIITKDKVKCPKGATNWECKNVTAKNFLMNLLRVNRPQGFTQSAEVTCESITPESYKKIEASEVAQLWALDFQREVKQSLKGQWVCRLEVVQTDSQQEKLGLAFIMNRDKSRIVSRRFSAWRLVQNI
jgi:hypothetical protein